jgi:hypothetical protein
MYITKFSHNVVVYFALLLTFAAVANAQATRTWVSGVGDDANPCSRTAPCKTFAGTISKTANTGEINVLDPGGFGALTVTKSITVDGSPGFIAGVLVSSGQGIIVNANGGTVTLRNLVINGLGSATNGIKILNADAVYVENCQIFGFNRGISDERAAGKLFVQNSTIKNNVQANAYLGAGSTVKATYDNVRLSNSVNHGFWFSSGALVVRNCVVSSNTETGILGEGTAEIDVDDTTVSNSIIGIGAGTGNSVIRIANSTVTLNKKGLNIDAGSIDSYGNNKIEGNLNTDSPTRTLVFQ